MNNTILFIHFDTVICIKVVNIQVHVFTLCTFVHACLIAVGPGSWQIDSLKSPFKGSSELKVFVALSHGSGEGGRVGVADGDRCALLIFFKAKPWKCMQCKVCSN